MKHGRSTSPTITKALAWLIVGTVCVFMLVPVAIVVPMAFTSGRYLEFPPPGLSTKWFDVFLNSADWQSSFVTSIQVALITTLLSLMIGVPAAFSLTRGRLRETKFLIAFFGLPLAFPVIVSAVSVYYFFGKLNLVGSYLGLALAHTVLALPAVILPMVAVLKQFDIRLEWQARSLGASWLQTIWTVTLPLIRVPLSIVGLFAFIISFDEIVFAIFLSSGIMVTLPKRIWEGMRFDIQPTVAVVGTILLVLSTIVILSIILLEAHVRKRHAG